jgi:phosphatidylinositol-3-phosphatase
MRRRLLCILAAVVFLATSAVAVRLAGAADGTVEFAGSASATTFVSAAARGTNYDNASVIDASHVAFRALLQFNTGIPAGSTVDSATLVINPVNASGGVFQVYNVGSFDPASVTWSNRPALGDTVLGASASPTDRTAQSIPLVGLSVGDVTNVAVTYSQPGIIARIFGLPNNAPVLDVVYSPPGGTDATTTTTSDPGDTTTTTTRPGDTTTTTAPPTTTTTTAPPTTTTTQPTAGGGHKVLVVMEENHGQSETLSSMPYLTSMADQYGQATNYFAITHPSLPNYLAIFGGDTFGVSSDCSVGSSGCVPAAGSVWDQTIAAGETAKAYQESMTSNCQTGGAGAYVARHGPWAYWTDGTGRANCSANDVPSGTTTSGNLLNDINSGNLPVTGELTPNLDDDAHDGSLAQADTWLQGWLPIIMAGPDYTSGNLTIIVTFDEDDSSQGNQVQLVAIDPGLSHVVVNGTFNHYSLTRWLDDNAGVPLLRNAASAPDLRAAFGL